MAINEKRNASFARKSDRELGDIAKSGSLGAACAEYHLRKRGKVA